MNWRIIAAILCAGVAQSCQPSRPKGPMTFTELGEWEAHQLGQACAWILVGSKEPNLELERDTIWGDATGFLDWQAWASDLREGDAGWVEWPGVDRWNPEMGPSGMGGRWWIRVERVLPKDPVALAEQMLEGSIRERDWLEAAVRAHSRNLPVARWQQDTMDGSWVAQVESRDTSSHWKPGAGIWLDIRSASLDRMDWPESTKDTTSFPAIQWAFRWGDEGQTLPALNKFLRRHAQPGIYWWAAPASAARGADGTPLAGHTPEMPGFYRIEVLRDSSIALPSEASLFPE